MALVIYNTLTRRKEPFVPLENGKVSMYVCGVTAYDKSHLGHARSAINFDIVVRYLRSKGYDVLHITNFTDVDDKLIARAHELDTEPLTLSKQMIEEYFSVMDGLKIKRATAYPKASETIPDIIKMVRGLEEKDLAYESNGSVYFVVRKAKDYGKLSGQSLDQMITGTRNEPGEDKRDPMDFALWKAAKPGEVSWDSPWGKGRPGWHIECSAMCLKHLGKTIDIHGGGTDLIFPHHENEILQSEAYNDAPFVRYWMHNGMLTIGEEKMSKSIKNFFLVDEVLKTYSPEVVRFFVLNASYRQPLEYAENSLDESKKALDKLQETYSNLLSAKGNSEGSQGMEEACDIAWDRFTQAMDDDFSTREAIAVMFELARAVNKKLAEGDLGNAGVDRLLSVFDRFNALFDVLRKEGRRLVSVEDAVTGIDDVTVDKLPIMDDSRLGDDDYIQELVQKRELARKHKEFEYADRVRDLLAEHGIVIQDTPDGAVWKRR